MSVTTRTWRYLYPSLKLYGQELIQQLNYFMKIGVGISDCNADHADDAIYILLATSMKGLDDLQLKKYRERLNIFLNWLKNQPFYITDYVYNTSELSGKHMIVLKIPRQSIYSNFIKSRYSLMYTNSEINGLFQDIKYPAKPSISEARNRELSNIRSVLKRY